MTKEVSRTVKDTTGDYGAFTTAIGNIISAMAARRGGIITDEDIREMFTGFPLPGTDVKSEPETDS